MWVLLVLVVIVGLWMVGAYNGLISLKNQTLNAFKQIDVQLKRRHDLIPNLVNAVRGAMDFEKSTLEAVIQARNQAVKINAGGPENIKQISQAENQLSSTLARQLYNDTATQYNTKQQQFPTSFVAGLAKAQAAELWELEDQADKAVPQVDLSGRLPPTPAPPRLEGERR